MIKTFEQFVFDKYNESVNEAFQSNKLREIIKQHGKPKHSWELKMLYDLKDDEIVDVVSNRDEYYKNYSHSSRKTGEQATFMLELEDGTCIVISNLDILKACWDDFGEYAREEKNKLFKKRHSERHKGNLGKKGELDIRKKHRENVEELYRKRLVEKLQPNISEIVDEVQSVLDSVDTNEFYPDEKRKTIETETEFRLGDDEYMLYIDYEYRFSDADRRNGGEFCDIYYSLVSFGIEDMDGTVVSNDELDITYKTYEDLFKEYKEEDVECGIYDPYEFYGVSRSDFFSGI
jgi:hypothetical protein